MFKETNLILYRKIQLKALQGKNMQQKGILSCLPKFNTAISKLFGHQINTRLCI